MSKSKKRASKAKQSTNGLIIAPCGLGKRVSGKPNERFVLQSIDGKEAWVSNTETIEESEDPKLAVKFTARFSPAQR